MMSRQLGRVKRHRAKLASGIPLRMLSENVFLHCRVLPRSEFIGMISVQLLIIVNVS